MSLDAAKDKFFEDGYTDVEDAVEIGYQQGRADAIDEFLRLFCEKFTEYERKGWMSHTCVDIKHKCADIAEQMKGETA